MNRWLLLAAAVSCVVIGLVVLGEGSAQVIIVALVDSLSRKKVTAPELAGRWLLITLSMVQLALAGCLGRLLTQRSFPRLGVVFAILTLASGAMVVIAAEGPLRWVAAVVTVLGGLLVICARERWIGWLAWVWLAPVLLVLGFAVITAIPWNAVLLLFVAAAAVAVASVASRHSRTSMRHEAGIEAT